MQTPNVHPKQWATLPPTVFRTTRLAREALAAQLPKQGVGVEIGVFRGDHARLLFDVAKPKRLYLIDKWGTKPHPQNEGRRLKRYLTALRQTLAQFHAEIADRRVILHRGPSSVALASYPDNFFDWAYVDADHSYAGALADLHQAARVVKNSGAIAGHDYSVIHPEGQAGCRIKVYEAVVKFTTTTAWKVTAATAGPLEEARPAGFLLTYQGDKI